MLLLTLSVFWLVRLATSTSWAWVVLLSLMALPELIWTSQHVLTEDLLATALAAATGWAFLVAARSMHFGHFALLGLVAGLGSISAPSYVWFLLAFLGAAWTLPAYRGVILAPAGSLSFTIAAMVAAGPYMDVLGILSWGGWGRDATLAYHDVIHRAGGGLEMIQACIGFCGLPDRGSGFGLWLWPWARCKGRSACRRSSQFDGAHGRHRICAVVAPCCVDRICAERWWNPVTCPLFCRAGDGVVSISPHWQSRTSTHVTCGVCRCTRRSDGQPCPLFAA